MTTIQVMNTDPAPYTPPDATRRDAARDGDKTDDRETTLDADDQTPEEAGYGYGV
jgi:hypothetical protein